MKEIYRFAGLALLVALALAPASCAIPYDEENLAAEVSNLAYSAPDALYYSNACEAMTARCDFQGDEDACMYISAECTDDPASIAMLPVCDTACCAHCTRCANGGDCTYCERHCG